MCNDNRSHVKEMVISITFKYIISLPCRLSRQSMASKQILDGSWIAYFRRSYHLVTWQEAHDIIIYLYSDTACKTKLSPFVIRFLSSVSLPVFPRTLPRYLCKGIHTNVHPSFVPNKHKDYVPARIVYSNRFINMHVYITSLLRTGTQKSNLVFCSVFSFFFFLYLCSHLLTLLRSYF